MLRKVIEEGLVDYIAMDLKTSLDDYQNIVGKLAKKDWIKESIELIMESGLPYEFRSTLIEEVHSDNIIEDMVNLITGADKWYLQAFRPGHTLLPEYNNFHSVSNSRMKNIQNAYSNVIQEIYIR